jgi:RiboL-PSP-HEPN
MPYVSQFAHADAVMAHLAGFVPALPDPQLQQKYIGFASVAAVTVYELAIKDIFVEFASKKHAVLEEFVKRYFRRINGKVGPDTIVGEYIPHFGDKYTARYKKSLKKQNDAYLRANKRDFVNSYRNLLTWRHNFVHAGQLATTVTFPEVVQAYEDGKHLIHCLASSMKR